jgi:hypothetical protein
VDPEKLDPEEVVPDPEDCHVNECWDTLVDS